MSTEDSIRLEFVEHERPPLKGGRHVLRVRQELSVGDATFAFQELEQGFRAPPADVPLTPGDIAARWPPEGNTGDHSVTLPHIALTRPELPWMHAAGPGGLAARAPWLALLVIEDDEIVRELPPSNDEAPIPGAVFLTRATLEPLLPTVRELALSTHVRKVRGGAEGRLDRELAVIMATRLPQPGTTSRAMLVSLARRYDGDGFNFDAHPQPDDLVRLPVLHQWRFTAIADRPGFVQMIERLDRNPATLRLPEHRDPDAERMLARGLVPLPHRFRDGTPTASWYRGPLGSRSGAGDPPPLPVFGADDLLVVDDELGMIDVSLAAAWQLGRSLALSDEAFSTKLVAWKRSQDESVRIAERQATRAPSARSRGDQLAPPQVPSEVESRLERWNRLQDLPFHYLIPEEAMLPPESLRFFRLDPDWIAALLDGAISMGRVLRSDSSREPARLRNLATPRHPNASGMLLRSELLNQHPSVHIEARTANDDELVPLTPLRSERLQPDLLLMIWPEPIARFDLALDAETMRFGVRRDDDSASGFVKDPRGPDGTLVTSGTELPITLRGANDLRVVDLEALSSNLLAVLPDFGPRISSPELALTMLEGSPRVKFHLRLPS